MSSSRGAIPSAAALRREDVHVWFAPLGQSAAKWRHLERTLSDEERRRASQFVFERDRRRYIAARGLLRTLLASYLQVQASEVRFQYGEHGKPALADEACGVPLTFSVAHSGDLALYAIANRFAVGVDVERIRPVEDADRLAREIMSDREYAGYRALTASARPRAFLTCWTRKEACLKATGVGLTADPSGVEVFCRGQERTEFRTVCLSSGHRRCLELRDFAPTPDYTGTVAAEGQGHDVFYGWWPGRRANCVAGNTVGVRASRREAAAGSHRHDGQFLVRCEL
jgi:4'-phosphopantetheinyl transferase